MSDPAVVLEQGVLLRRLSQITTAYDEAVKVADATLEQARATKRTEAGKERAQADALLGTANGLIAEAQQALKNANNLQVVQKYSIETYSLEEYHPDDTHTPSALSEMQEALSAMRAQIPHIKSNMSSRKRVSDGIWITIIGILATVLGLMAISETYLILLGGLMIVSIGVVLSVVATQWRHPYEQFAAAASSALSVHAAWLAQIAAAEERDQREVAARQEALDLARRRMLAAVEQIRPLFAQFSARCAECSPAWDDASAWSRWQPSIDPRLTSPIPLGVLHTAAEGNRLSLSPLRQIRRTHRRVERPHHQGEHLSLPALLPFPGGHSLVIRAGGDARQTALGMVQSALLRILASVPPGQTRFTFIDPMGLGSSAAAFMHLADYDDVLVNSRSWNEPQQIERQLQDLSEHMQMVKEKYLRTQYESIVDYNEQAGEVAEPYRVLVVFGFPINFSDTAARRLASIAATGPSRGVYTIVIVDPAAALPHGFTFGELAQGCAVLMPNEKGQGWLWLQEGYEHVILEPDGPPDLVLQDPPERTVFGRIINAVGERSRDANRVEVPFEKLLDLFREQTRRFARDYPGIPAPVTLDPATWWTARTAPGIIAPLGRAGATKVQALDLGKGTNIHALIAGRVGSGKSTLLHAAITSLALLYPPDELELYLIDFKEGVEFKVYATHQLPHARVIAVQSEREFGLSVLTGLEAELKARGDLFRATTDRLNTRIENIADYRESTGERLPRIVLLVDEFQVFFTEDDQLASQAARILDLLVRQGRSAGIHVVLGSQTLAGSYSLARSTIDQMAVRIALQCSEADSRLILADDNPAARMLSRPGEAIYNSANGLVEGNALFQVAWLPDEQRDELLRQVASVAAERHYRPPRPQRVFEGNASANLTQCEPLIRLLNAPSWKPSQSPPSAWLGDPVAISDPTAARFQRQGGSNLAIVGQDGEAALGLLTASLLSLAAQYPPVDSEGSQQGGVRFVVLDFSPVDAPEAGLLGRVAQALPHEVRVVSRRATLEAIADIAAELERRTQADHTGGQAIYLLLYGLQRARDLRPEEDSFGGFGSLDAEPAPNPSKQFAAILRDGPEFGIHTIAWCDTRANLERSLERRALREFDLRVVFQMSGEDSSQLIDSQLASKLGPNRALLYSEERGRAEKFRPYGLLPEEMLLRAAGRLAEQARLAAGDK